jgi:hypothetical protein
MKQKLFQGTKCMGYEREKSQPENQKLKGTL